MSTGTRPRSRIKERSPEAQREWEAQKRAEWRAREQRARTEGSWPQLFALRDAVGADDLVALMDIAMAGLAQRVGLPPFPPGDTPTLSMVFGRWGDWHQTLVDRLRPEGTWDALGLALKELAERQGVPWPLHQVATPIPPAQATPDGNGSSIGPERHT